MDYSRTAGYRLLRTQWRLILAGCLPLLLAGCLASRPVVPVEDLTDGPRTIPDTHTVQPGDTLYSISFEYGVDYREVAQVNQLKSPYLIRVGERLRLAGLSRDSTPAKASPSGVSSAPLRASRIEERPLGTTQAKKTEPAPPSAKTNLVSHKPPQTRVADNRALKWRWPTEGRVLKGFSPQKGAKGIDIGGRRGQPVYAAEGGEVVYAGSGLVRYGKLIIVKHNDSYLSAYAHNERLLVKDGDKVRIGQRIADLGATGTDKEKLHFEIRKDGKPQDPLRYLPKR